MSTLPANLLIPLVDDPNEGFEEPLNINADSLASAGFYPQNATSADFNAGIYRDSAGNLVLKDANAGTKTLSQLSSGGGSVTFAAPVSIGSSNTEGVASTAARSDHVHALPAVGTAGTYGAAATVPVITTDSQGRVSGVTPTTISITATNVSDFSSAVKSVIGTSISAGTGISSSVNYSTGVVTLSNNGVTSVFAGTGISLDGNAGGVTITNSGVTSVNGNTGVISGLVTTGDSRLTDSRTPTAHAASHAAAGSDALTLAQSQVTNLTTDLASKVATTDSRLSDARTPTAHAASHAAAGSDYLTLAQSQITNLTTDLAAKAATSTTISAGSGLSGGGDLSANRTISMPAVGTAGTYGSASSVPVLTTDAQGRVSSVTGTTISITSSNVSNFSTAVKTVLGTSVSAGTGIGVSVNGVTGVVTVSNTGVTSVNGSTGAVTGLVPNTVTVSAGAGLSGGGDLSANRTISMPSVGTAGTYGSASQVPVLTTDAQGRVSGVTNTGIQITESQVTNLTTDLASKAADSAVVHLTGNESVGGVKTFSSSPSVPTPSASGDAASKGYVDTQVSAVSGTYAAPVQDVTALRALTSTGLSDKQLRLVEDKGALYRYDTAGTGSDDGDGTITPTDNPTTGRWFKVQAATQAHNSLSGLQGGAANDYQHLTTSQLSSLTGATDANTASAIVKRDASGNFTAGTVTAALSGNATTATTATNATNVGTADDTTTNATYYPTFVTATSGNNPVKVSSTKLTYNPAIGTLTATSFSGPSTSAGKLTTSRSFALTGDVTGSVSSDLTSGASIATTHGSLSGASMHAAATALANGFMPSTDKSKLDAATNANTASTLVMRDASGNFSASTITATTFSGSGASLTSIPNSATTATSANTASAIVARDASGNFTAGTITAALSGNATTATSATSATTATNATNVGTADDTTTVATYYPTFVTATSGNNPIKVSSTKLTYNPSTGAITATAFSGPATSAGKLTTARTFALTGDVTGSVSSDLTTGASIAATLANAGTAGTYGSASQVPVLTTDAKGRVTGVTNTSIAIAESAVTNLTTDLANRPTGSSTAGYVGYWSGTSALSGSSNLFWDNTNARLGVGTAIPTYPLQVVGAGASTVAGLYGVGLFQYDTGSAALAVKSNDVTSFVGSRSGTDSLIGTATNHNVTIVANATSVLTCTPTQRVGIGGITPSYTLDVNGTAAASNIKFPAAQVASSDANTLDDYEEGTWTPVLNATNGTTNTTVPKTLNAATYIKIGRLIFANCWISSMNYTGVTSTYRLQITGLPFSSDTTTNSYTSVYCNYWGTSGSTIYGVGGYVNYNSTTAEIHKEILNGDTAMLVSDALSTAMFTFIYRSAS